MAKPRKAGDARTKTELLRDLRRNENYLSECVWVAPTRCGGDPCIGGTRITTSMAASAVWNRFYGDGSVYGAQEFADDYGLTERQVLIACWYEAVYGRNRALRKAWAKWAEEFQTGLYREVPPVKPKGVKA